MYQSTSGSRRAMNGCGKVTIAEGEMSADMILGLQEILAALLHKIYEEALLEDQIQIRSRANSMTLIL